MKILLVLGVIVAIPYVLGPLLVRATNWHSALPQFNPVDLSALMARTDVGPYFTAALSRLRQLGFRESFAAAAIDYVPKIHALLVGLENEKTREQDLCTAFFGPSPQGERLQRHTRSTL